MAPLVFLGPDYDSRLKMTYTTISDDNVYKPYSIFSILLSLANIRPLPALSDNNPLTQLVARLIDNEVFRKVAVSN